VCQGKRAPTYSFFGTLLPELTYFSVARSIALDTPEVETHDCRRLCAYLILSSPYSIILSTNSPLPNILSSANTLAFLRLNDMICDQPPRDRINPSPPARDVFPGQRRGDLVGGGLIRSAGGWPEVLSMRRREEGMASDDRVLESGEFIEGLLEEAEKRQTETLRLRGRVVVDLEGLGRRVEQGQGVDLAVFRSGSRTPQVVAARRLLCQLAVKRIGHTGAEVARYLAATTSFPPQVGLANSEDLSELSRYL
jgi:hypothetical protein